MNRFMDAIILAGGLGKRLRETVSDLPKPLAPIRGKPFLDILLSQLEGKVNHVIMAIGYKGEQIKAYYRHNEVLFSEERTPLGTGGAVKLALSHACSSPVLILNGDSYFEIDFDAFFLSHKKNLTIACREVDDTSRYGSIFFDEDHRVTAFREKEAAGGKGWINGGIYLMDRELAETLPEGRFSLEEELFPSLIEKGVFVYPSSGKFIDIGTKESYFEAQGFL